MTPETQGLPRLELPVVPSQGNSNLRGQGTVRSLEGDFAVKSQSGPQSRVLRVEHNRHDPSSERELHLLHHVSFINLGRTTLKEWTVILRRCPLILKSKDNTVSCLRTRFSPSENQLLQVDPVSSVYGPNLPTGGSKRNLTSISKLVVYYGRHTVRD